ncbi:MAG: WYL domain-containing protein [Actinomycetota bacterium]|nr:WYL domain-containing protein [Actinomycetota bacterium]
MSAKKTERLVNLVICLLATRRYLSVGQIRDAVPGYAESGSLEDEAFRRMFERDKEELRELGIPLETGSNDGWDDEVGYRIARRDYELPEIDLAPDEAAALGLAARLWQSAEMAQAASSALLKLQAAGVDVTPGSSIGLEPRVDVTEPAFAPCLAAVRAGRVVRFDYRGAGGAAQTSRELEPWGVVSWHGHWYVVGHDRGRDATRVFRLSRVAGPVEAIGPAGAVSPPPGVDLLGAVADLAATTGPATARVRVRTGAAVSLRRDAVGAVAVAEGWDEIGVPYADPERLADRVAGYGSDVVLLEPAEARTAVIRRLRALAEPAATAR